MTNALGTSTANAGGNAIVTYTLMPDPTNPQIGTIQISVRQNAELYDRYDWQGTPIAYNSSNDTVATPSLVLNNGRLEAGPILILNSNQQIVGHYPPGTDIKSLPGFTYIEYPPDSPDLGAAGRLWDQYNGVTPSGGTQVFGTFDHPFDTFAGDFHAVEANGSASAFDVYSQWSYEQTYAVSYTIVNGIVNVTGNITATGSTVHTNSSIPAGSGTYVPINTPPVPTNPRY